MTIEISMDQEICLILGQVSLSLLYEMRNLQTDICGTGETDQTASDIQARSTFQHEFLSMSSEFTFGDNSDTLSIFHFLMNLVDRDLTECQITQTLTLSRLHAQLKQPIGIRLFTHTKHVDWNRQGHPLEQTCNPSFNLPFNAVRIWFVRIRRKRVHAVNPWLMRSMHRICHGCWYLSYIQYVPGNRSRSLIFQFHRLWKRSQR